MQYQRTNVRTFVLHGTTIIPQKCTSKFTTKRNFIYVRFNFFGTTGHTAQTSDLVQLIHIPG